MNLLIFILLFSFLIFYFAWLLVSLGLSEPSVILMETCHVSDVWSLLTFLAFRYQISRVIYWFRILFHLLYLIHPACLQCATVQKSESLCATFFFRCIKGKAAKVCMDGGAWLLTYPRLWGDRVERPRAWHTHTPVPAVPEWRERGPEGVTRVSWPWVRPRPVQTHRRSHLPLITLFPLVQHLS